MGNRIRFQCIGALITWTIHYRKPFNLLAVSVTQGQIYHIKPQRSANKLFHEHTWQLESKSCTSDELTFDKARRWDPFSYQNDHIKYPLLFWPPLQADDWKWLPKGLWPLTHNALTSYFARAVKTSTCFLFCKQRSTCVRRVSI